MAGKTLAAQWLSENGHSWSGRKSDHERKVAKAKRRRTNARIQGRGKFLCNLDQRAFGEKIKAEQSLRRTGRNLDLLSFIKENVSFSGDHCLFIPDSVDGFRASVTYGAVNLPAARLMCILAHGSAPEEYVARHLCGNGHLNCVNPTHLKWGTHSDNARDKHLHRVRPMQVPAMPVELQEEIASDERHRNVIAIEYEVHSWVVEMLRLGWRF